MPIAARLPKCKHRSVEEEEAAAARPLPRAGGCGSRKDLALLSFHEEQLHRSACGGATRKSQVEKKINSSCRATFHNRRSRKRKKRIAEEEEEEEEEEEDEKKFL